MVQLPVPHAISGGSGQPLVEIAEATLQAAPYAELRQVHCQMDGDRLVLLGSVPNFYLKQLAQTMLLNQCGTTVSLENRLKVECGEPTRRI